MVMKYVLNFKEEEPEEVAVETSFLPRFFYGALVVLGIICLFLLVFLRFAWVHADYGGYFTSEEVDEEVDKRLAEIEARRQTLISETDQLELRVVAEEKTWSYLIFDGMRKREMMLQPGDEVTWSAEDTIRIRLGNAGGIKIYYRGYPLQPLGESGEVTDKIITLDDGELRIRPAGNIQFD
ncbi:MAG: RodZ domain-containing protein [bacterium]